jgi:16S rRNA (cytosine967-C5)-methyltransferase
VTPPARLQAAIELLEEILQAARNNDVAADTLVARYFRSRRYAGSKDRAAVRDMLYAVLRSPSVENTLSGRTAVIDYAEKQCPDWIPYFGAGGHAPAAITDADRATSLAEASIIATLLKSAFPDDWQQEYAALLSRAPLFLRVAESENRETVRQQLAADNIITELTYFSPWGLKSTSDKVDIEGTSLFQCGVIDVQDEGSQIISLLSGAVPGATVIDLCAGAGGKTLALAAMMRGQGRLIAHDIDPDRLDRLAPRAARAGISDFVDMRTDDLSDLTGQADCVLVDAPCSGSGTWRRNPEARLRLTTDRLERLSTLQNSLIHQAAGLARPGGRILFAVCSVLVEEGEAHLAQLPDSVRVMDWRQAWPTSGLCPETASLRPECLKLTPFRHGCDGFFIVCLEKL